jgi:hypothetical protein
MTRINVGIDPTDLHPKHLIAEHREIKRIPNAVRTGRAVIKNLPEHFTLGTGHVKFFYNKLGYLLERYRELYLECLRRGFEVQNYESAWRDIPPELMGSYTPTEADKRLIEVRIREKLSH